MATTEHTPGKWKLEDIGRGHKGHIRSNGIIICTLPPRTGIKRTERTSPRWAAFTDDEREANARLIAAAPDLLEACQAKPDATKRFTQSELQEWNAHPEHVSVTDVSRLICWLNDTWYDYTNAQTIIAKATA